MCIFLFNFTHTFTNSIVLTFCFLLVNSIVKFFVWFATLCFTLSLQPYAWYNTTISPIKESNAPRIQWVSYSRWIELVQHLITTFKRFVYVNLPSSSFLISFDRQHWFIIAKKYDLKLLIWFGINFCVSQLQGLTSHREILNVYDYGHNHACVNKARKIY